MTRVAVVLTAVGLLLALGFGATAASADSCPNTGLTGFSQSLPDCRAYELASTENKLGYDIGTAAASPDGDAAAVLGAPFTPGPTSPGGGLGIPSGAFWGLTRTSSGWMATNLVPPQAGAATSPPFPIDFSWDFSDAVYTTNAPLSSADTNGADDVYLLNPDGSFTWLTQSELNQSELYQNGNLDVYDGRSADWSKVFFDATGSIPLSPDAPASPTGTVLYEADASTGALSDVCVLPDGSVASSCGLGGGSSEAGQPTQNAISTDGSTVVFTSDPGSFQGDQQIYLRRSGQPTVEVSASQASPLDPNDPQPAWFEGASADQSKIFFLSQESLTNDATTGGLDSCGSGSDNGVDLYEYDASTGELGDLTVDTSPADSGPNGFCGGDVQGVVAISSDASYVYFVAYGAGLASNANVEGETATPGADNLYVSHEGAISFIATLDSNDQSGDWLQYGNGNAGLMSELNGEGSRLLFFSDFSLTGYDNTDVNTGQPDEELYEYDASDAALTCVSCNPSGGPPKGGASLPFTDNNLYGNSTQDTPAFTPQAMSGDGDRVFFTSADQLTPTAVNGKENVYEWEQDGDGSCQSASDNGHCLYLISDGAGAYDSIFQDASANGNDVFFLTRDQLVPEDQDENVDLYDARVDGGFSAPPVSAPCSGSDCQGPPTQAPALPTAGTVSFTGPGNVSPSAATPGVNVPTRIVHGSTFLLTVRVPATGLIAITGTGIRTVRRAIAKAGSYQLRVTLTPDARRALHRSHELKLTIHVVYEPANGTASAASFPLTVKPLVHLSTARTSRLAKRDVGGGR